MFATIWMCTQEWSLICRRAIAFTFETCQSALSSVVVVDAVENGAELAIAARRHADPHLRDRLRGRHARLALGVGGGRRLRLDQLLGLVLVGHRSAAYAHSLARSCSGGVVAITGGRARSTAIRLLELCRRARRRRDASSAAGRAAHRAPRDRHATTSSAAAGRRLRLCLATRPSARAAVDAAFFAISISWFAAVHRALARAADDCLASLRALRDARLRLPAARSQPDPTSTGERGYPVDVELGPSLRDREITGFRIIARRARARPVRRAADGIVLDERAACRVVSTSHRASAAIAVDGRGASLVRARARSMPQGFRT